MLARIRKSMEEKDQGFTLIELLVVMIIIGILAAIAIPVFLGQRQKARDTSTKADVSTVGKEVAAYYVDGTAALNTTLAAAGGTLYISTNATPSAANALTSVKLSDGTNAVSGVGIIRYSSGTGCTNANGWYVTLDNRSGQTKTWYYTAQGGLTSTDPGASFACS